MEKRNARIWFRSVLLHIASLTGNFTLSNIIVNGVNSGSHGTNDCSTSVVQKAKRFEPESLRLAELSRLARPTLIGGIAEKNQWAWTLAVWQ